MKWLRRFQFGFSSFWSSFAIIRKYKNLQKYIYLPIFISFLFLIASFYVLLGSIPEFLMAMVPLETGFFYWLVYGLFFLFTFLFVVLVGFLFANIVAMPFNAMLCEKYWKKAFQWQMKDYSWIALAKISLYFLLVGLIKAALLVLIAFICFLLSFFPIFSLLAAFVGLLIIAFDCSDMAFEMLEMGLKDRFRFMKKYFWEMAGFATAMSLISIIPGFNFLFLPFMVLSASHMVYQLHYGKNKNERNTTPENL